MKETKRVFVFGNEVLDKDSLPLKILPELRRALPGVAFEAKDPNEEWDSPEELTVIDTVIGPKEAVVFDDLGSFTAAPRFSLHDFDALANLRYLQKLEKIKRVTVIGIPPDLSERSAIEAIKKAILADRS
ncbi:MAG: hypothetical protein ABSF56_01840 [Minisyncoccia bacterium]|jgi:hypothetical protein